MQPNATLPEVKPRRRAASINPYHHHTLAVLWLLTFVVKAWTVRRIFPYRSAQFLFAFCAWAFLKTGLLLYLGFTLQTYPYFFCYWGGAYVADVLGLLLAVSVGLPALTAYQPKAGRLMTILTVLLCLTALVWWMSRQTLWDYAMYEHALRLGILGVLVTILSRAKMYGRERVILLGLLAMYGTGWAVAGWLSFLPDHYTASRGIMWAADLLTDCGVFGWWAWKLTPMLERER